MTFTGADAQLLDRDVLIQSIEMFIPFYLIGTTGHLFGRKKDISGSPISNGLKSVDIDKKIILHKEELKKM